MSDYQTYDINDDDIRIPDDVAICPGCGGALVLEVEGHWKDDDGWLRVDGEDSLFKVSCLNEPDPLDEDEWSDWLLTHAHTLEMPYVYWLPAEEKVNLWLEARVRFTYEHAEQEKLARWKTMCA